MLHITCYYEAIQSMSCHHSPMHVLLHGLCDAPPIVDKAHISSIVLWGALYSGRGQVGNDQRGVCIMWVQLR